MTILMSKQPSYVRCIKPNDSKKAGVVKNLSTLNCKNVDTYRKKQYGWNLGSIPLLINTINKLSFFSHYSWKIFNLTHFLQEKLGQLSLFIMYHGHKYPMKCLLHAQKYEMLNLGPSCLLSICHMGKKMHLSMSSSIIVCCFVIL